MGPGIICPLLGMRANIYGTRVLRPWGSRFFGDFEVPVEQEEAPVPEEEVPLEEPEEPVEEQPETESEEEDSSEDDEEDEVWDTYLGDGEYKEAVVM